MPRRKGGIDERTQDTRARAFVTTAHSLDFDCRKTNGSRARNVRPIAVAPAAKTLIVKIKNNKILLSLRGANSGPRRYVEKLKPQSRA